ncbi:phage Gp37/Gp68 family protein [Cupriavidus sp. 8B]
MSPACHNCYAADWAKRYGRDFTQRTRTASGNWKQPLRWDTQHARFFSAHGRRRRIFCASLADVFDNQVDPAWRVDLLQLIANTPNLDWLLLTKRIGNAHAMLDDALAELSHGLTQWADVPWPNVWLGATVCNQEEADRDIPKLMAVPARVRFLSMEPLLGPVDLRLPALAQRFPQYGTPHGHTSGIGQGVDWVIAGGESGARARPMHPDWVRSLRDQCSAAGVPFLLKQWGEWGQFVNEDHYTHCDEERCAHAWVDRETGLSGKCWIIDDDGRWSNWTGNPPTDDKGNVLDRVAVMGWHGKQRSGRLLDSVLHDAYPTCRQEMVSADEHTSALERSGQSN